jgi:hypothetical protein
LFILVSAVLHTSIRRNRQGVYATISDFSKGPQTNCNGGFLVGSEAALIKNFPIFAWSFCIGPAIAKFYEEFQRLKITAGDTIAFCHTFDAKGSLIRPMQRPAAHPSQALQKARTTPGCVLTAAAATGATLLDTQIRPLPATCTRHGKN